MRPGILIVLTVAAVVAASVLPASAEAKPCGSIQVDGRYYTVGGAGVSCKYMRRWSRRMIAQGRKPKGWYKCTIRKDSGGCHRGPPGDRHDEMFIYYPPD